MKVNIVGPGPLFGRIELFFGGIEVAAKNLALRLNEEGIKADYNGKANDYDIVNLHVILDPFSLKRLKRKTKVITHGHVTPQDMKGGVIGHRWYNWAAKAYLRWYYSQADQLVSPSSFGKSSLREIGVTAPIEVISNGINLAKFAADPSRKGLFRKEYNLPDSKLIVSIGSLFPRKGLFDVVNLAKKMPDHTFVWVGTPLFIYHPFFLKAQMGSIPPNMHFTGYYPGSILDVYADADIIFFPTYVENQGIPTLEAAACQVPLVVRDIPVFNEWLTHGENCLMGSSLKEYEKVIIQLLNDNELSEKLTAKAFFDVQQHSHEKAISKIITLYEKVLSDN